MPMTKIADMPFAWIPFDKKGKLDGPLPAWPIDGTVTDVVIVSHGWKTDVDGASSITGGEGDGQARDPFAGTLTE